MLDVARHHKVRNNPDLYTAIEEMLGGSVGTSKYARAWGWVPMG